MIYYIEHDGNGTRLVAKDTEGNTIASKRLPDSIELSKLEQEANSLVKPTPPSDKTINKD